MSRLILNTQEPTEIYITSIYPSELLDLSNKTFVSNYGHKSRARIIQDAKSGNEKNYRLILKFKTGKIQYQLQSLPITAKEVKLYGFETDDNIEKYEDIGGMLKRFEDSR